jgi:hypothetical protein
MLIGDTFLWSTIIACRLYAFAALSAVRRTDQLRGHRPCQPTQRRCQPLQFVLGIVEAGGVPTAGGLGDGTYDDLICGQRLEDVGGRLASSVLGRK